MRQKSFRSLSELDVGLLVPESDRSPGSEFKRSLMRHLDRVGLPAPRLPAPRVLLPLQTALVLLVVRGGGRGGESITCGGVGQAFTYLIYFFSSPRSFIVVPAEPGRPLI